MTRDGRNILIKPEDAELRQSDVQMRRERREGGSRGRGCCCLLVQCGWWLCLQLLPAPHLPAAATLRPLSARCCHHFVQDEDDRGMADGHIQLEPPLTADDCLHRAVEAAWLRRARLRQVLRKRQRVAAQLERQGVGPDGLGWRGRGASSRASRRQLAGLLRRGRSSTNLNGDAKRLFDVIVLQVALTQRSTATAATVVVAAATIIAAATATSCATATAATAALTALVRRRAGCACMMVSMLAIIQSSIQEAITVVPPTLTTLRQLLVEELSLQQVRRNELMDGVYS